MPECVRVWERERHKSLLAGGPRTKTFSKQQRRRLDSAKSRLPIPAAAAYLQCDQMVRLFFIFWPFAMIKNEPNNVTSWPK